MTDITGSDERFFIWDREQAKFVATSEASAEQMRRYGESLYTSAGSGRGRVMTVFDPQGRPTSYAVAESTRRGELVPAGRAAGRAGLGERREQERVARGVEGEVATRVVEGRQVARQREERQRELNRDYIDFDFQNETGWLRISEDAKRMLLGDPTLLENQDLSIRPDVIMDYVKYGNPASPGLLMEGLSLYYINVETPFGRRWINVEHATPEELAAAPRQVPLEVVNDEYRKTEYQGLGEYNTSWDRLTDLGGDEAARRRWESVVDFFTRPTRSTDGAPQSKNPFSDMPNFPQNAFSTRTEIATVNGVPGVSQQTVVANPSVLLPWIVNNYETLSASQKRQIDNLVVYARNNFVEDQVATLSPEEQRIAMRRGGATNPWTRIVTAQAASEGATLGTGGNAAGIVTTEQRTQQVEQSAAMTTGDRRFAARYSADEEFVASERRGRATSRRRMFFEEAMNRLIYPASQYEFSAVPLGFAQEEFVTKSTKLQAIGNLEQMIRGTDNEDLKTVFQKEKDDLFALDDETKTYQFVEGTAPLTMAQRQYLGLARRYSDANTDEEIAGAARGLSAAAYTRAYGLRSVKPLTAGEAQKMLRDFGPVTRSKIKMQMAAMGLADPSKYTTDTSLDKETRDKWEELVLQANSDGVEPLVYLSNAVVANADIVGKGTGSTRTVRELRLPSVDDVVAVVQDVARNRIGRRLDTETASQVANAYLGVVESNFRTQSGASTFRDPMSAESFGEQQITQQAGGEEMMYQTGLQLQELVKMIGGG